MNVDAVVSPYAVRPPEVLGDVGKIPLPDGCAVELMAIHVLEHVYRWQVPAVLAEWHRLLAPGGRLVLEMPDLVKCCKNVLAGREDQQTMWGLYGDPRTGDPFMVHRWGWTFQTLAPLLQEVGFRKLAERPTQWHVAGRKHRDFRVEGIK